MVGEALLLYLLPLAMGTGLVAAAFLAGGLNLAVVAVVAPVAGIGVRRQRPDLPRAIARDYAATWLMVCLAGLIVVLGIAHHPAIRAGERAFQAQSDAVRLYVAHHAAAYRARIDEATSRRLEPNLYRTCVPGANPNRQLCLIVDTKLSPPGITVDPDSSD